MIDVWLIFLILRLYIYIFFHTFEKLKGLHKKNVFSVFLVILFHVFLELIEVK